MDYIGTLLRAFDLMPSLWWFYLILTFSLSYIVLYLFNKEELKVDKIALRSLLSQYLLLILYMTIIGRTRVIKRAEFIPFWSYIRPSLWSEILLNYVLFIPFGFLLFSSHGERNEIGKRGLDTMKCVLIGFLLSFLIEANQFVFYIGLFEFDDIIGNTLGTYIGVMIARRIITIRRERRIHY